ncbi:MAG: sirohydrochlorin cobaltochelatase [Pseudomonadota bacterium]
MSESAIVLAAFGAANPRSLIGITAVLARVRAAFAATPVRLAFTSQQIRRVWRTRADQPQWLGAHPDLPPEVLAARGPLAAIADLHEEGAREIVVQSLHIYAGEEFADLRACVQGLASIRAVKPRWTPFRCLALGRPALGQPGIEFPYQEDLKRAAQALAGDAAQAKALDAALVYAGHGNPYYPSGVYQELEMALRRAHPGLAVAVGEVEGAFSLDYVRERLVQTGARRVLLKPLMLVAGQHAHSDLAGDEPGSWRRSLEGQDLAVTCDLRGLGENPAWAEIYVENIRQTAASAGISL